MPENPSDDDISTAEASLDLLTIAHAMADHLLNNNDAMRSFTQLWAGPDTVITDENVAKMHATINAAHGVMAAMVFLGKLPDDLGPSILVFNPRAQH